jgi:O-antigen/teichoic acid export membrane protein
VSRALAFGLPDIPVRVGGWALRLADRLVLQAYVPLSAVGVYAIGAMLGTAVFEVVATAVNSAILPFFYATAADRTEAESRRVFARVAAWDAALIGFLALGTTLFAREAILLLTTRDYLAAQAIVPLVAWAAAFQALAHVPSRAIYLARRTGILPIVFLVPAAVNVGLALLLVPRLGIVGAAYAALAAYPLLFALTVLAGQRVYRIPYDWGRMALALGAALALSLATPVVESGGLATSIALKTVLLAAYPAVLLASGFVAPAERTAVLRALRRAGKESSRSRRTGLDRFPDSPGLGPAAKEKQQ